MTPSLPNFIVRNMTRDDLRHAFDWSVAEGWNIGLHDHDVFYATDPHGFFLGELNGEPIGSVSGVAYNETFGFIGIYIVRTEFRGQGYGLPIFQAAMNYLGGRNIGLDGVIEQQENYRRAGFRRLWNNRRYEGTGAGSISPDCVPLNTLPFHLLDDYDRRHFPAPRPQFLRGWVQQPGSVALGVVQNNVLVGYGMIRPCVRGHLIAPLFADNERIAETLFQSLAAQCPGETIYLDVPETNPTAIALAERHGMTPVFETARMVTGPDLDLPFAEIFGITSYELG